MANATPTPEPLPPGHSLPPDSAPDPSLLALPEPRRPWRRLTLAVLALVLLSALGLLAGIAPDLAYAARGGAPLELSASTALPAVPWGGVPVAVPGNLEMTRAIRYTRPLDGDSFRLAPLVENPKVWVELRVPADLAEEYFLPPGHFEGRLVRRGDLALRHSTLIGVSQLTGPAMGTGDWLLVDGETAAGLQWLWALALAYVGCATFAAVALARLLRPVRD